MTGISNSFRDLRLGSAGDRGDPATRGSGPERIRAAFAAAAADGRAALVPYLVTGRPSLDSMPQLVLDAVAAGADVVELGLPFSDPLADGSIIRTATRAALDSGVTTQACLEVVAAVRAAGCTVPIIAMGYVNPLLSYGIEAFCAAASRAGVDGLIVPDVPLEESRDLGRAAAANGLAMTFLATPLTSDERIAQLVAESTGFVYVVATTGVTGARTGLDPRVIGLLGRTRRIAAATGTPVAVGFGVSTAEHVTALAPHADGVIVGSALVDLVERSPAELPAQIARLAAATRRL